MLTGVAFIVVGVVWMIFGKPIARYQYRILVDIFRLPIRDDADQTQAVLKLGLGFAGLLLIAGLVIVTMEFGWRGVIACDC